MTVDCECCRHQNTSTCDDCSIDKRDGGCACHLGHPPCGYCENSRFEEIEVFIHQFIMDIGSGKTTEDILACVQSYYLKYPDRFRYPIDMIPGLVSMVYKDASPAVMQSRKYSLVQLLTNYRELPEEQQKEWEKSLGQKYNW